MSYMRRTTAKRTASLTLSGLNVSLPMLAVAAASAGRRDVATCTATAVAAAAFASVVAW
jgi:hypothetical protein